MLENLFDREKAIENVIALAGWSSMCWSPTPAGVFDAHRVKRAVDAIQHHLPKYLEVRDSGTMMPLLCVPLDRSRMVRYCGFDTDHLTLYVTKLQGGDGGTQHDPNRWDLPWMVVVHKYVRDNWNTIPNYSVLDFRVIRGEVWNSASPETL